MSVEVLAPEFANQYIHLAGQERMTSRDMLDMIREMMGGDITLNFQATSPVGHYVQTPYNYTPKLGRRLTSQDLHRLWVSACWIAFNISSGGRNLESEFGGSRDRVWSGANEEIRPQMVSHRAAPGHLRDGRTRAQATC